ncbi:MAG TPA: hypothetical protein VKZ60_13000 [Chloroflexota bacterium]|nr:hypothetical protein [Chloroflexota bacterium]
MATAPRDPRAELVALRTLALRLLAAPWQPGLPAPVDPQATLLAGQVPPAWPSDLPFPPGAHLVGSLVRSSRWATVVVASALPAAEVLAYYRRELSARGWHEPEVGTPRLGGFAASGLPGQSGALRAVFVRSEQGPTLTVQTLALANALTDVRLDLQTDPQAVPRAPRGGFPMMATVLPTIAPPPRAWQWPLGGSISPSLALASTVVEADADLAALAAHYRQELERAGWILGRTAQQGAAVWSL